LVRGNEKAAKPSAALKDEARAFVNSLLGIHSRKDSGAEGPDPTRRRILDAAYELFYRTGFSRVGVYEVAAFARVTKEAPPPKCLQSEKYRKKWGLKHHYPMVALAYAAHRSQFAKKMGLGNERGGVRKDKGGAASGAETGASKGPKKARSRKKAA
jgi:hypothetical protein